MCRAKPSIWRETAETKLIVTTGRLTETPAYSQVMLSSSPILISGVDIVVTVFAFITLAGDAWFVLVGLALLYWIGPRYDQSVRPAAVFVVSLAVVGLAVVLTLKIIFALPRPSSTPLDPTTLPVVIGPFVAGEINASGFTFPSGHAVAATVVYGGLGVVVSVGRRRTRYLLAVGAILLIGLSRLVLGVHYPRDVIGGIAVGATIVAVGLTVGRDVDGLRPDRLFGVAAVVGLVGFVAASNGGHTRELTQAAIAIGTAVAGSSLWYWHRQRLIAAPPVSFLLSLAGFAVAGGLWVSAYAGLLSIHETAIASGLAVSCILLLPLLAAGVKKIRIRWP